MPFDPLSLKTLWQMVKLNQLDQVKTFLAHKQSEKIGYCGQLYSSRGEGRLQWYCGHKDFNYQPLLELAINNNNMEMLLLLLDHQAPSGELNKNYEAPISVAARQRKWDFVVAIAQKRQAFYDKQQDDRIVKGDNQFCFALSMAIEENQLAAVKALIAAGTLVVRERWYDTLYHFLHAAVRKKNLEIIELLLTMMSPSEATKDCNGKTALELAAEQHAKETSLGNLKIFMALQKGQQYRDKLFNLIKEGKEQDALALIAAGASQKDPRLIVIAMEKNLHEVVKKLSVNNQQNETAMQYAVQHKKLDCVKLLDNKDTNYFSKLFKYFLSFQPSGSCFKERLADFAQFLVCTTDLTNDLYQPAPFDPFCLYLQTRAPLEALRRGDETEKRIFTTMRTTFLNLLNQSSSFEDDDEEHLTLLKKEIEAFSKKPEDLFQKLENYFLTTLRPGNQDFIDRTADFNRLLQHISNNNSNPTLDLTAFNNNKFKKRYGFFSTSRYYDLKLLLIDLAKKQPAAVKKSCEAFMAKVSAENSNSRLKAYINISSEPQGPPPPYNSKY